MSFPPFPPAYSRDCYVGVSTTSTSHGLADVAPGAEIEIGFEAPLPGILRHIALPIKVGESFPRARLLVGDQPPVDLEATFDLEGKASKVGLSLDDVPYASLTYRVGEWVKLVSVNASSKPTAFLAAFVVRVESDVPGGPARWAFRESGPVEVAPGEVAELVVPAGAFPFKTEYVRLVGGAVLEVLGVSVAGREQLAASPVPGAILDGIAHLHVDVCPSGKMISMSVRNTSGDPVVTNLKLEGCDYDESRSSSARRPLDVQGRRALLDELKADLAEGDLRLDLGDDEDAEP